MDALGGWLDAHEGVDLNHGEKYYKPEMEIQIIVKNKLGCK